MGLVTTRKRPGSWAWLCRREGYEWLQRAVTADILQPMPRLTLSCKFPLVNLHMLKRPATV